MSLMSYIQRRKIQNVNIVHVHLAYQEMKDIFSNLSVILSLTWKEEDGSDLTSKVYNAFQKALKDDPKVINVCQPIINSVLLISKRHT